MDCDIIAQLNKKVDEYAEHIQLLLLENQTLREQLLNLNNANVGDENPPRKIPKVGPVMVQPETMSRVRSESTQSAHVRVKNGSDSSGNSNGNNNNNNNAQNLSKKKKIIQVIDTDLQTVKQNIKSVNCKDFTLHQKGYKGPIKIAITNNSEIPIIRESLIKNSLSFHEYKWQDEKAKCFVLKGLVGATDDDIPYIKQELINAGLPDSITLVPLYTGYMRANPGATHSTLFKLVIPPNIDVKLLLGIKYLDHVAVKFEKINTKSILQCKNCQRFGHSASGCQHPHRCVKCGEKHYRNDCPRTHNKNTKLRCCNCGGEHTANNLSECQFFIQRYAKNQANKNTTNSINNKAGNVSTVVPELTFAQVLGGRSGGGNNTKNDNGRKVLTNGVGATQSSANIENKLDILIQMVSCHEAILQKLIKNG